MTDACFLLDTNICIYLIENLAPKLTARVRGQEIGSMFISAITLGELARGDVNAALLAAFTREVPVRDFDQVAARVYGTLPFRRARFDRLIAAHALALGFTLVTNDERDFADIPGLRIENWTQ